MVELSPEALDALAAGDLLTANLWSPVTLSSYFVGDDCLHVWVRRNAQVRTTPEDIRWIARVIYDQVLGVAVGRSGFHRGPNDNGLVEVGFSTDPAYRRRGYGQSALVGLLHRAIDEPSVRRVRAAVRPDNPASRGLVQKCGFVAVGAQVTAEDGLETVFEVGV